MTKFLPSGRFWRRLVLERLHRLLAVVVVFELIQCFADYWWEETYSIVYGVLAVTAVTELLFTRLLWVRLILQFAAAAAMILRKIPIEWGGWPESWRAWDQVNDFMAFHLTQFHPFFELAAGAILTVHALAWLGSRRFGAIAIIVCSIMIMTVVDSFFPLELWRNIAWIVTAGLAWLVVLHLRQLQVRHPDSWEAIAERPLDIAFPAVIIITIVLVSGIIMPRAPIILEDPYTIWTEAQGREVPVFSGEGGVQRTSASGGSGSSLSGYSRDDRKIGGGFQFDYSPVMTVTTSQRSYWRGESKAVYTGKGWEDLKNPALVAAPIGQEAASYELDPPRAEGVETIEVVQTVQVERRDKLPVLFAAGPASAVTELKSDNNAGLRWNPEEWELRWGKSARVQTYSVVSEVTVLDEEALRGLDPSAPSSIDVTPYLQLPDNLPQRVRDLAAEQTGEFASDYDRAKALEQYLKTTYPYTNTPDLSRQSDRANGDFVDEFLFEIQEGYCDYFSTSFVVLARSIGLPARWVKGYATGYDQAALERARYGGPDVEPDPLGAGTYTVRNADAHSWAEVYFEGYGWIPFEPTSGFSVPQPRPANAPEPVEPAAPVDATPVEPEAVPAKSNWLAITTSVVGALLLAAAVAFFVKSRRARNVWSRLRHRGTTPNQRVVREMERLLSFLHRQGLRRESHETIRETFDRWSRKFSSLSGEFEGAVKLFEQARYGGGQGDGRLLTAFNEVSEKIRKAL
ncbi:transglutaminase domain-containing protein [Cohnella cellulosilytica]|uniref:Transglutaminase domain-containing protein n=1 Tax=Cohnella cellulosilytica TaxID=986710 RepID=A0ABW2F7V6_9BACL